MSTVKVVFNVLGGCSWLVIIEWGPERALKSQVLPPVIILWQSKFPTAATSAGNMMVVNRAESAALVRCIRMV